MQHGSPQRPDSGPGRHLRRGTARPSGPRPRAGSRAAKALGATVAVSLAAGVVAVVTAGAADTVAAATSLSVAAAEDTYVYQEYPDQNRATSTKLTASNQPSLHTRSYLRFVVRGVPTGVSGLTAHLTFQSDRNQPQLVELHGVASTSWSAATMTMRNAPAVGDTVASARPAAQQKSLDFDLSGVVTGDGTYSFALVDPLPYTVSAVFSSEHGSDGPRLTLDWSGTAPAPGTPSSAAPSQPGVPSLSPVAPTSSSAKPTPTSSAPSSSSAPAPAPAPSGGTMFGVTAWTGDGLTQAQALARATSLYGQLEVVRVFYPGLPAAWPGAAGVSGGPVVVSFKALPQTVLSGTLDAQLTSWFQNAPRDRQVIWTYFHEPEDDIARGSFTAAQYRAAWQRLRALSVKANNPSLKSSLVLMGWSLKAASGRNWKDYYPGASTIDILGWDCYNMIYNKGDYSPVDSVLGQAAATSKAEGKPWGVAELGSKLVPGDDGTRRAAWLRALGAYAQTNGATYVTYFDAPVGGEFRLLDVPSQQAWRYVIAS